MASSVGSNRGRLTRSQRRDLDPPSRGWRRAGGGHGGVVVPAPEWRGVTNQVAGLRPWCHAVGLPTVGVPLGQHESTRQTICWDPLSWFLAGLQSRPSCAVCGVPGTGKSTLARRLMLILSAWGHNTFNPADTKGEHVELTKALGGTVIPIGRGVGGINIVDTGMAGRAAAELPEPQRGQLMASMRARRQTLLTALLSAARQQPIQDFEEILLAAALEILDAEHEPGEAVLDDLITIIYTGADRLRHTVFVSTDDAYDDEVRPLLRSLTALTTGPNREIFGRPARHQIDLSTSLVVDISRLQGETRMLPSILLACWSEGFAAVEAQQALVAAGLRPRRNDLILVDEYWRVARAGLKAEADALTRLDRHQGVGTLYISHSLTDFALGDGTDANISERVGALALFGVPRSEISRVRELVDLNDAEADLLASWGARKQLTRSGSTEAAGKGKLLLKVGERIGVPIDLQLTNQEIPFNNTNQEWERGH